MVIAELPPVSQTAKEPQTVNFDTVLEPDTEYLASVVWSCPTLTLGSGSYGPAISTDRRKASFWYVGGAAGRHEVTATYTTDNVPPRIDAVNIGLTVV
jgi:hypothetical protein